jgi:hypothetical protein
LDKTKKKKASFGRSSSNLNNSFHQERSYDEEFDGIREGEKSVKDKLSRSHQWIPPIEEQENEMSVIPVQKPATEASSTLKEGQVIESLHKKRNYSEISGGEN